MWFSIADGGRDPSREGPVRADEDLENGRRVEPDAAISGAERPTAGSAAVGPEVRLPPDAAVAEEAGACGSAEADAEVAVSSGKRG